MAKFFLKWHITCLCLVTFQKSRFSRLNCKLKLSRFTCRTKWKLQRLRINTWKSLQTKWSSCLFTRLGYSCMGTLVSWSPKLQESFFASSTQILKDSKNARHLFLNFCDLFKVYGYFEYHQLEHEPWRNLNFYRNLNFSLATFSLSLSLVFCFLKTILSIF